MISVHSIRSGGSIRRTADRLAASALLVVTLAAAMTDAASAAAIETRARQAILIDMSTDTVLLDKEADRQMPTSSMSKMMTAYMVYDAVKQGRFSLDDRFPVSERAWRMTGSKMFLDLNDRVWIEDLVRGLVIQSGNDAAVTLAEGLAGTEEAFAAAATRKAHEIGMPASQFRNASGWPAEGHFSTARDLATLAERLIRDFPEFYHYDAEVDFTWNGIRQGNRNPLLYRNMGVDGLKTGHTKVAGYGLAASGERAGRRLILVVNGLPSMQARADESARLLEWGWAAFTNTAPLKRGEPAGQVRVGWGEADTVQAEMASEAVFTIERGRESEVRVTRTLSEEVAAPVSRGMVLGKAVVEGPGGLAREVDIVASADVPKAGLKRMFQLGWQWFLARIFG